MIKNLYSQHYFLLFLNEFWNIIQESAPYLLMGLLMGGFLKVWVGTQWVQTFLGYKGWTSIFRGSVVGIPLPLCSCSVLPTAKSLRIQGASKPAVSAFLVSTPETGVDSLLLTYSFLGWPYVIIRFISAFITSMFSGLGVLVFSKAFEKSNLDCNSNNRVTLVSEKTCCPHDISKHHTIWSKSLLNFSKIIKNIPEIFRYAFINLLDDISPWLFFGFILSAFMSLWIPADFFSQYSSHTHYLVIFLISLPTYVCASASTPIGAMLLYKGVSPGALMIFLILGPASNISQIFVLKDLLGYKELIGHFLGLILSTFMIAFVLDSSWISHWLESFFDQHSHYLGHHQHKSLNVQFLGLQIKSLFPIIFSLLMTFSLLKISKKKFRKYFA
jgi:uncharacterized membrane protein YraQ (UPF0718 family)